MPLPFPFGSVNRAISEETGEGPLANALRDLARASQHHGGSNASYRRSFTQADLVASVLTVTHSLNQDWVSVTVWNNLRKIITPTEVESLSANVLTLDLSTFTPIAGTWTVVVIA